MIKTVKIGERDVRFDASLSWMFLYKTQFSDDPIDIIMPAVKAAVPLISGGRKELTTADIDMLTDVLAEINFTEGLQLIWSLAANADRDIDEPIIWYHEFEVFPLDEILRDVAPAIIESCISSKKFKALSGSLEAAVPKISALKASSREA